MKDNVPPAAMAAIIVVVVALIAFIGYKLLLSGSRSAGPTRDDMKRQMMAHPTYPGMTAPGSVPTRPGSAPGGGAHPTSSGYPYSGSPTSGGSQ